MIPFYLFALLSLASLTLPTFTSSSETDDLDEEDIVDDQEIQDVEDPALFLVSSNSDLTGTDGSDSYILADATGDTSNVTIDAGAGADVVDLTTDGDGNDLLPFAVNGLDVFGGDGDDVISTDAGLTRIEGGAGNDEITAANGLGSFAFGGEGDDTLSGSQDSGDPLVLSGDAGNDVIDGRNVGNAGLYGGEGDDEILVAGANEGGAGYVISADGGAGDDILRYSGGALTTGFFDAPTLLGGIGADTFALTLDEGGEIFGDPDQSDDGTARFEAVNIGDFDRSADLVVIEGMATSDAFTLASARLETVSDSGEPPETALVLRYESDVEPARDVVVEFGTADVTLDDLIFVGDEVPGSVTDTRAAS